MSNTTVNIPNNCEAIGGAGNQFDLPVKAATHIYEGSFAAQSSGGYLVPYSTAGSGPCVGVTQHESDNTAGADGAKRCRVETRRMYAVPNGTSGDAFADTDKIGSLVYASDDHTAAKTSSTQARQPIGFFFGFEADATNPKVRVYIDPALAKVVATLQALADTPASADALRDALVAAFG